MYVSPHLDAAQQRLVIAHDPLQLLDALIAVQTLGRVVVVRVDDGDVVRRQFNARLELQRGAKSKLFRYRPALARALVTRTALHDARHLLHQTAILAFNLRVTLLRQRLLLQTILKVLHPQSLRAGVVHFALHVGHLVAVQPLRPKLLSLGTQTIPNRHGLSTAVSHLHKRQTLRHRQRANPPIGEAYTSSSTT